ncbi:MAG: hypothetical protein KJ884_13025 [Gammaproteobacteria bacterium]|nr:hypothetical protein [Gammaproteobacteria bacterium]MBU1492226.1 hypothetical protein [Gammaproteobacteria bacterium]MBU2066797.1 hypothetical protein [Gammaproteobacteria bacterium]MBU2137387.1 hypothetical protein [Gammaproteobacteria bacterium]MBU2215052.1 hypothetical protein [Gammaproteobacteria bacterium]
MDDAIEHALGDGCATYQAQDAAAAPTRGIEVMVDHALAMAGAGGRFLGSVVGITWRKRDLASVEKGGVWRHGRKRYIVDEVVVDDGDWITAACMEAK